MEDFDKLMNNTINLFSNATSSDPDCRKRYENAVVILNEMEVAVKAGTYPRDYTVLPLCHYIERHMDPDDLYDAVRALDKWYADHYRSKKRSST